VLDPRGEARRMCTKPRRHLARHGVLDDAQQLFRLFGVTERQRRFDSKDERPLHRLMSESELPAHLHDAVGSLQRVQDVSLGEEQLRPIDEVDRHALLLLRKLLLRC
jgi:hypothetical protein